MADTIPKRKPPARPRSTITHAAPKYGPTGDYGDCEVPACTSVARTTCEECGAEVCLGHAEHQAHAGT